jgi:multiple antibiotic resistance protein
MADHIIFFLNSSITLFSVLDPIGAVGVFLVLTANMSKERRQAQVGRTVKAVTIILLVFTFTGAAIFKVFGISISALLVAGGLILMQMSLRMLEGKTTVSRNSAKEQDEAEIKDDIAIIPMAIPFLAGPGAITTVIVFASRTEGVVGWVSLIISVSLVIGLTYIILLQSQRLAAMLGETGMRITVRVMGIILLAMGAEFTLSGIKGYFN